MKCFGARDVVQWSRACSEIQFPTPREEKKKCSELKSQEVGWEIQHSFPGSALILPAPFFVTRPVCVVGEAAFAVGQCEAKLRQPRRAIG